MIKKTMARSSLQPDPVLSYMDGIQVKIAEAYKPPRKVTLPAAYNNKFPDTTRHTYDFSLEKSVLQKLAEWRKVRTANNEVKKARIEDKKRTEQVSPPAPEPDIPKKVTPTLETTILTPQRLSPPLGDLQNIDLHVKANGLDYADFDNDTSSPFDNMELKTINDMEELAQVLQPRSPWIPPARIESILQELTLANGPEECEKEKADVSDDRNNSNANDTNIQHDLNRRNISMIVEELQRELDRPHAQNWKPWPDLEPASNCDSNAKPELSNSMIELSEDDEKLAKTFSDMGFPVSRAARAISSLGSKDNKKVVEYLLAVQYLEEMGMSGEDAEKALNLMEYDQEKAKKYYESLCILKDLGFTEDQASKALLKCDIDSDKALDFLCA